MEPLNPSPSLLCKLGSIAVHVAEMLSGDGHVFDRIALQVLLDDDEVAQWLSEMDELAMITRKRNHDNGS